MAAGWLTPPPRCLTSGVARTSSSVVASRGGRSAVAAIAALLAASCDGDSPTTNGSTTTEDAGPSVVTPITAAPSDAWPAALITGPLTLENDCFYVDATEGGRGVAVFEHGTTFDSATGSIVNPDGSAVPVGSTIEASGGGDDVTDSSAADLSSCAERAGLDRYVLVAGVSLAAGP